MTFGMPEEVFETRDGRRILLRNCESFEELDGCIRLQTEIWGYSEDEVIPRKVFIVARRIGGQVIGAFDLNFLENAGGLVGFAMALPGVMAGQTGAPSPYLHSHMLAVKPEYRNDGVGRRLKLFQRLEAMSRGIERMEWTFDPLEIKNSFLNIHRLGVIVRSYTPNFYGVSSSRLQGRLPTDRLHAEWHLNSKRVKAVLQGHRLDSGASETEIEPGVIEETILVPRDIGAWKSSQQDVGRALAVQVENRERFKKAFARGLAVTGFHRDTDGNGVFELGPFETSGAV